MKYPVAEKFVSINGEGPRAGELAVFIRFRKCNLACSYCDTKWANSNSSPAEFVSAEELCDFAQGITNVTLTGGEPLLQDVGMLIDMLIEKNHRVEIETNGSISIKELSQKKNRPSFTMDYKLPSSNMEKFMCIENFAYLTLGDTVKFVAGTREDLEKSLEIITEYELINKCKIYLSPVYGAISAEEIVDFMKENSLNDVRVQLQLHKYIWSPDKRGV